MTKLLSIATTIVIISAFISASFAQELIVPGQGDINFDSIPWDISETGPRVPGIPTRIEDSLFEDLTDGGPAGTLATLTVIHAIPGLPAPVDVYADGGFLFSFDFFQSEGPLTLPEDSYFIEVRLSGKTVLSGTADLAADKNYTAIAHLVPGDPDPGIKLSFFENDVCELDQGMTRVTIRHTADAPAVDIGLSYGPSVFFPFAWPYLKARNLSNGDNPGQFGAVDLPFGFYQGTFYAACTDVDVYTTDNSLLIPGTIYIVYAVGSINDGTFALYVQTL